MGTGPSPLDEMPSLAEAALFLDFDGTLVDLAPTPDSIHVPADLPDLLAGLRAACSGALAIVSGRTISDLQRFLPGLGPPMVGAHGGEWWLGDAPSLHPRAGSASVAEMTRAAQDLALSHPALLVEEKPAGVVLHYRADPSLAGLVEAAAARIVAPGFETHPSKMAIEIRPDDVGKDAATARLMDLPAFSGRRPVFLGDDTTDEVAIAWVQSRGGLGIRVGGGESVALARLPDPASVRALLSGMIGEGTRG